MNPDIFESDDVANLCPVSYRTINQSGGTTATTEHICRHYRARGEFDLNTLNTLRVKGRTFESGKKKLWIQKYPDTCGQGLSLLYFI